ncbi:MAG: hypothetical protein O3A35_02560 [Bacteroidetes bacterium]|nr:hypothetical protein [Bacteroidota bacterium]
MSDYPSLSRTTKKWDSRSEKNRERLENLFQLLLQCEVKGEGVSSFFFGLAVRVDRKGDICSLAKERMGQSRKNRRSVDKGKLDPWLNVAKGKLNESQRDLKSTAAYLEHGEESVLTFSAFVVEAQKNRVECMRRIELCIEEVATLKSTIQQLQEGIEAWDEA